jgi:hypothetical protein
MTLLEAGVQRAAALCVSSLRLRRSTKLQEVLSEETL